MRPGRAAVAALCCALAVAACSDDGQGGGDAAASPPTLAEPTRAAAPGAPAGDTWVFDGAQAVSGVRATEETAAFTTHVAGEGFQAVVLDLATGSERWRVPMAERGRPYGMGIEAPAVVEAGPREVVVTLEPLGLAVAWVGRDARTGEERWRLPTLTGVASRPCGDVLCLSGRTRAREPLTDLATGEEVVRQAGSPVSTLVGVDPADGTERWRMLMEGDHGVAAHAGDGVAVVLELGSPRLRAFDLGTAQPLWTADLAGVLEGVDTDGGWSFHAWNGDEGEHLLVSVSRQPRTRDTATPSGVASVTLADGSIDWHRDDVELVQGATEDEGPFVAATVDWRDGRGSWSRLERLDPATGAAEWERPLDPPLPLDDARFHLGDAGQFWVAHGPSDWLGIDRAGGAELTAAPGTLVWEILVEERSLTSDDGEPAEFLVTGRWGTRELPGGQPVEVAGPPPRVRESGDWRLWLDREGRLHAARAG